MPGPPVQGNALRRRTVLTVTPSATTLPGSRALVSDTSFDAYVTVQVCSAGGAATALGAAAEATTPNTLLSSLEVGTWPSASGPGATELSVVAPVNETIASGACATYAVHFQLVAFDDDSSVTITFVAACEGQAAVVVRVDDFGGG